MQGSLAIGLVIGFLSELAQPPTPLPIEWHATVSTDSTYPGYNTAVLSDGRWIETGQEPAVEFSHPDRLGNVGNTWVSAEIEEEHWIRLDWPEAATIGVVEICWSLPEWQPHAFRIERLRDGRWSPVTEEDGWLAAAERRSVVAFPPIEIRSLRVLQPASGGGTRHLMAAQEVRASRGSAGWASSGVRVLRASEVRRLLPRPLERNIARLECPGAASALAWLPSGQTVPAPALADGDADAAVPLEGATARVGIAWATEHVVDGLAVAFAPGLPAGAAVDAEVHDGHAWVPIPCGIRTERSADRRRIIASFEPVATRTIRVGVTIEPAARVTEVEVYRFLPSRKDIWPKRLVGKGGLRDELLASPGDPSFEALALASLSMLPARALLGLPDEAHEVGVAWDGTILGRRTLRCSFGEDATALAEVRDTVRRRLIDGWRPGTVVEGRVGMLAVEQTAFVAPLGADQGRPTLFVRIALTNVGDRPAAASARVEVEGADTRSPVEGGALFAAGDVAAVALGPCRAEDGGRLLRFDVTLAPGDTARFDLVAPQISALSGQDLAPYRAASFEDGLARFRALWDRIVERSSPSTWTARPLRRGRRT
jgi:hypothetical protein